ncbi:MAG: iron chaperone [Aliihoeflea sp.]|uniref:iron chaperone n=1 Tax=Aliihoeflea sp. TaxID=2608088 RepID=UPI004033CB43
MTEFLDHDAYIAAAPEALRSQLAHVRGELKRTLPDAEEVIQYGMPGFSSGNRIIAGYGAFSKQCGLYVTKGAIAGHREKIAAAGLKASKTGDVLTYETYPQ